MIDLFTNGLQLKLTEIKKYTGSLKSKAISYFLILVLVISMITVFNNFYRIDLSQFIKLSEDSNISLLKNRVTLNGDTEMINSAESTTGILIEEDGLQVANVGFVAFENIINQASGVDNVLAERLKDNEGPILTIFFITLYLKSLPFILIALLALIGLSVLLRKSAKFQIKSRAASIEMTVSLMTLPSLLYLILNVAGFRSSMSLFFFVASFVILVFYFSMSEEKDVKMRN